MGALLAQPSKNILNIEDDIILMEGNLVHVLHIK